MHVDWKNVSHLVAAMVGTIVPGVQTAETLAWKLGSLKGKDKQDAVAELVRSAVTATNATASRAIVNSEAADAATRAVIDAVVNLHHVVAVEAAAHAG
jgi:glutamate racemase